MSPIEEYTTDFTDSIDSEMQYTPVPASGPPRDSGLPPDVLTIRLDSTNDSVPQITSTL
jgi:hypothetical protein